MCKYDVIHKTARSTQLITRSPEQDLAVTAIGDIHRNFGEVGTFEHVVPEIRVRTDLQTDRPQRITRIALVFNNSRPDGNFYVYVEK